MNLLGVGIYHWKKKNLRPIGRVAEGKPEGPEQSVALESGDCIGINSRLQHFDACKR